MSTFDPTLRPRAPNDNGRAAGDYGVRFFDATTTSQAHAIPREFCGCMVELYAAAEVHFAFSTRSAAAVDFAVAATAAGASANAGGILPAAALRRVQVPPCPPGETMYFVRDAGGSTTVRMELSSAPSSAVNP